MKLFRDVPHSKKLKTLAPYLQTWHFWASVTRLSDRGSPFSALINGTPRCLKFVTHGVLSWAVVASLVEIRNDPIENEEDEED